MYIIFLVFLTAAWCCPCCLTLLTLAWCCSLLQDCYLRFCADHYDPNNLDIYLHLSNNSVAKYYPGKKEGE